MSYRVELETRALREFKDLPSAVQRLLAEVLNDLQTLPRPPGAKKLSGKEGWRVRKGDYRVLYMVDDRVKLVRVYRIGNRRDFYRR